MRPLLLPLALLLLTAACRNPIDPKDTPSLSWRTFDTVFSYYAEKHGEGSFHSGDLLGLEMIGAIDRKTGKFIPGSQLDSGYIVVVTRICYGLLNERLPNRFLKNAEGYFKVDLSRIFPDLRVTMSAYLPELLKKVELDTLLRSIRRMPEVSEANYISKDEAKKEFLKENSDFSSVLDTNPLPASIEILIKEDFCDPAELQRLKRQLEIGNPFSISEIRLPNIVVPKIANIKKQYCILHFKT